MADNNATMDWDDVLADDGKEFNTLPEGDYTFTVTDFERAWFNGSDKMPACNMANITVEIDNDIGYAISKFKLFLTRRQEWKLSAFFRCIGQKKHGEKLVPDWGKVVGSRGKAHFKPDAYKKDGKDRTANALDRFYDYDESVGMKPVDDDEELPW